MTIPIFNATVAMIAFKIARTLDNVGGNAMTHTTFTADEVRAEQEGRKSLIILPVEPQPQETIVRLEHRDTIRWSDGLEFIQKGPLGKVGDLLFITMAAPSWVGKSPEERFWDRVIKTDTCWEWMGITYRKGYGRFKIGQRQYAAHRYSYVLHHGSINENQHVLHKCDVPWCVNPDHLYLGTNADNVADKIVPVLNEMFLDVTFIVTPEGETHCELDGPSSMLNTIAIGQGSTPSQRMADALYKVYVEVMKEKNVIDTKKLDLLQQEELDQ